MNSTLTNLPISEIHIGERFRREYGDIKQLSYSIQTRGLITPIAVGVTSKLKIDGLDQSKPYTLLAGGRRMQAITKLGWSTVPAKIFDQPLTELDYRGIELAENLDRKEMSYAEEAELKAKIHNLQQEIHGPKIARSADAAGWSQADTAKLLNETSANLSRDLKLAQAIKDLPDLGLDKCKNKNEAMKLLKAVGTTLSNTQASEAFKKALGTSNKRLNRLIESYIIGDCRETMKSIADSTIHMIEIDPPYAMDLHAKKSSSVMLGYNEVGAKEYCELMTNVFKESYRILRPDGWLICWFAMDPWFSQIAGWLQDAGFKFNLLPGIWAKPTGQTMQPETFLANVYEPFFYCRKGNPKLTKAGRTNVFSYPPMHPAQKWHPTQRPPELMDEIFGTFTRPMQTVYVPFLGSGQSILSADKMQCKVFGNDLTKEFKDAFVVNLKKLYPEG